MKKLTAYQAKRNPYRHAVAVLRALGYSTQQVAEILHLTQSAVMRLSKKKLSC